MKALSLTQPWASLVVHGFKRLETRSWATSHRGPLAIHACKRFPPSARLLCLHEPYRTLLAGIGIGDWRDVPTGVLLGVVEVVACTRAPELNPIADLERQLGDFGPGRWAWTLVNPRSLPSPIPYRGRLGVFELPDLPLPFSRCA